MKAAVQGFSLIELLITLAVLGISLALAMPNYSIWMSNTRTRTAAEAIQNGLQLARAEAVRRNALIRFQLTSSAGPDCTVTAALATGPSNWVVSVGDDDVTGKCDANPISDAFPLSDVDHNPLPRIVQVRPAAEGSRNVLAAPNQAAIVFNGLGRLTSMPTDSLARIDLTDPNGTDCSINRCLRVTVSQGGQIRMCDRNQGLADSNAQKCLE